MTMMRRRRRRRLVGRIVWGVIGLVLIAAVWHAAPHDPQGFRDWAFSILGHAGNKVDDAIGKATSGSDSGDKPGARQHAVVVTVVSADSLVVTPTGPGALQAGQPATVRLAGIQPPSTRPGAPPECSAAAATARVKALLAPNVAVTLERDQQATDRRGRPVRYVWVGGRLLNVQLVREGVAAVPPNSPAGSYDPLIKPAQAAAQAEHRGLWASTCTAGQQGVQQ
jgi:micrococcal nuclease